MIIEFVQRSYDRVVHHKLKRASVIALEKAAAYQQDSINAYNKDDQELGAAYAELAAYWLEYGNTALKEAESMSYAGNPTMIDTFIYWALCKRRPELEVR